MTVFGAYVAFQFIGTLYLQNLLGWSSFETALGFLPAGLLVAFLSPNAGKVADRIGTERMVAIGMALFVVGYALFLRIGTSSDYVATVMPTIVLIGLGFAITFPALNMQATNGVDDNEQGLASGLFNTSSQVGGAIVLAVTTAVIGGQTGGASTPSSVLASYKLLPRGRHRHHACRSADRAGRSSRPQAASRRGFGRGRRAERGPGGTGRGGDDLGRVTAPRSTNHNRLVES